MLVACEGRTAIRDRALIAVHYEAATRIGEIGRLRWRDAIWDEYGARLRITDTKTNKIRMASLTPSASSQYLAMWRDNFPGTPEGETYVFLSERSDVLTYAAVLKIFKKAAQRAGIKKKITTHLFRKSRGTHLIEQGLPIASVVELLWGNQNTKQIRTYIRMSPTQQDRILLKHAGIITDEENRKQERRITGRMCPKCHNHNSPTSRYCNLCGTELTEKTKNIRQLIKECSHDPGFLDDIIEDLKEIKMGGIN